jgi:general secretion pathway protein H
MSGSPRTVQRRSRERGLTLIEIIVVMTLIAVVTGAVLGGSMQLPSSRLRGSITMIASAIKVGYTRATATSRNLRLVMDLDTRKLWLEESDAPMLVQSRDTTGTGGADPVTEAERAAVAETDTILKGPRIPKPMFHKIDATGFGDMAEGKGVKSLQRGITFRSVQTAHDDAARTAGRAYLYFWPGGLTERASIQLRIGDSIEDSRTLTLVVASPLTGKVAVKSGPAELELPIDADHASDRTDTGF